MGKLTMLFHLSAIAHHIYAAKFTHIDIDFSNVTDDRVLYIKDYQFRYFTTWNMIFQCMYLILAIVLDILELMPNRKFSFDTKLRVVKGYIFTSFIFPFTLYVVCMFWTLFNIDRELVFPKTIDTVIPGWVNHSMHTNVLFLVVFEIFLNNRYIPSNTAAITGCVATTFLYNILFMFTYYQKSIWLYGVFAVFNWPERIAFILFNHLNALIMPKVSIVIQKYLSAKCYTNLRLHKNILKKAL